MDYQELAVRYLKGMVDRMKTPARQKVDGMARGEALILYFLNENEKGQTPSEISRFAGVSTARVTAAINNLENKGLIERSISSQDRRKVFVSITQKGKDMVNVKKEEALSCAVRLLEKLGEKDAAENVRLTEKAIRIMEEFQREEEKK